MINFDPQFTSKYLAAFSDKVQDQIFWAKKYFFKLPYAFEMRECFSSGDVSSLAPSELKKSLIPDLKKTVKDFSYLVLLKSSNTLITLAYAVKSASKKAFQHLVEQFGYIVGPSAGVFSAVIIRLCLGKRAPTSAPIYVSAFFATTVIVSVWVIQFFKHPKYQKIAKDRGLTEAFTEALPLPKAKIIEPLHSRHLLSCDRIDTLLQNPLNFEPEVVVEAQAKSSLASFKQYCDWVKKKINLDKATQETLSVLKRTVVAQLMQVMKELVLFGERGLIEDFLSFCSKDAFLHAALSREELGKINYEFGARLALLSNKKELISLFPHLAPVDQTIPVMDAIISGNSDKVLDLTAVGEIQPYKLFVYGDKEDMLLDYLHYKLDPINLFQASILSGNVENLQRIISSSIQECDWYQKDSKGQSMLALAALSGKKSMWDFIHQFHLTLPNPKSQEYLFLLYASIKSDCAELFDELVKVYATEEFKDISGALVLDLYEKAVSFGSNKIQKLMEENLELDTQLKQKTSVKAIIKASILGGNKELFDRYFDAWKKEASNQAVALKDAYEAVLVSRKPLDGILADLEAFEDTFDVEYQKLDLTVSSLHLSRSLKHLSEESLHFIVERFTEQQLLKMMSEKGEFFNHVMSKPQVLEKILNKCKDSKYLLPACAKEAIKLAKIETLKMICSRGISTVEKLADSNESLLSYSMLSFNPELINIILGCSPALSQALITELKNRVGQLRCHREDEGAYAKIIRMLDAKSLDRSSSIIEDPQLHLALVKAGAMQFVTDTTINPKDEAARGLLSSGLTFLGLM